jgi:O-acetyl-ADP-ribose deacetylase (regulator of RNase III)
LRSAYLASLALAARHQLRSIAFPAISCGVYAYPVPEAAAIALGACLEALAQPSSLEEVRFVLFSEPVFEHFAQAQRDLAR